MLSPEAYDALVPAPWRTAQLLPEARSILVIASGGRALWEALGRQTPPRPEEPVLADHPVDAHTRRALDRARGALASLGYAARTGLAFETRGGVHADFVALGRAAGLGAPSRLGLLIHPEVGPWLSIRALLLSSLALAPDAPRRDFDPCAGCPAPCLDACPGAAPQPGGFDLMACERGRARTPACLVSCAARRACPVGAAHAYLPAAEAHHMRHRDVGTPGVSRAGA